jgi:hypothetical protein
MIIYTPCYNEMPWTPYFLRHLLDFDCPIVISEGASESRQKNNDRSWDGSWELIQAFKKRWKDRVTVILHDYSLNTHGDTRSSRSKPRSMAKIKVWNDAPEGEWIVGLATDNIYRKSDIPKIKQACQDADPEEYLLMTGQRVFHFNFKTIANNVIPGVCGAWLTLWPAIWRKNNKYTLAPGDELLKHYDTRNYLADGSVQQELTDNPNLCKAHIIFRPDIKQFHYKNVKKFTNRVQRFGSEENAMTFKNYPLDGPSLEEYTGSHPSILDTHPWRHVKDCRLENPEFKWQDYLDVFLKP